MTVSPLAGKPAEPSTLVNVPKLIAAYYTETPDPSIPVQHISFDRHDYLNAYISDLVNVMDLDAIRGSKISMGVDPPCGAGVHYWAPMAEQLQQRQKMLRWQFLLRRSTLLWSTCLKDILNIIKINLSGSSKKDAVH